MGKCESQTNSQNELNNNNTNISNNISSQNEKNINQTNSTNYIIGEIYINDNDINNDIRIINSCEEYERCRGVNEFEDDGKNEEEIKKCEIRINNELISFDYFHKFQNKGNYTIKYTFKNLLNNICHLFNGCENLINIDLSNFNTNNVTNMSYMFSECSSLNSLNLSNFNTYNVTNMSWMFSYCST